MLLSDRQWKPKSGLRYYHLLTLVWSLFGSTVTWGLKFWKFTGFLSCSCVPATYIYKLELFQSESALPCLQCPTAYFVFIVNTFNRIYINLPFALAACASLFSRHSFSFPSTNWASVIGYIQYVTNTKSVVSFSLEAQTGGANVPREK